MSRIRRKASTSWFFLNTTPIWSFHVSMPGFQPLILSTGTWKVIDP